MFYKWQAELGAMDIHSWHFFFFGKFELPPAINALELGQICSNFGQIWLFCAKTIIFFIFFSSAAV